MIGGRTIRIALTLAALLTVAWIVPVQARDFCYKPISPRDGVRACTEQINSGKWRGKSLAILYNNRGRSYGNLKQQYRAIADFNRAIAVDPGYPFAYHNRGGSYARLGQYRLAIADYSRAIAIDQRFVYAYWGRARAYHQAGQAAKGLSDADRALQLAPQCFGCLNVRGRIYWELGRRAEAIRDFRAVLKLSKNPIWVNSARDGLRKMGVTP